ncbi:MAG: galactose mutarotase [Clostridia bacterium]|nr:galactose mutarotase [Clostridia bacterium]
MTEIKSFGKLANGTEVDLISIKNASGSILEATNYGACITGIKLKMGDGSLRDVVLGYDTPGEYEADKDNYFGATIGRVANRIGACDETGRAGFILNGKTYYLPENAGAGTHIHGGNSGFNDKIFAYTTGEDYVEFKYTSPDGEENYPGNLALTVRFTFDETNKLTINYDAVSDADTICNVTNHCYFNLAGHDSGLICTHKLQIDSDRVTELLNNVTTGKYIEVAGTPYDFNEPHEIGERINSEHYQIVASGGYDCNYVLKNNDKKEVRKVASVESPTGDIKLTVSTDSEGVQLYSSNCLKKRKGKGGATYDMRHAVCLETQMFPDSINKPHFPSTSIIRAGEHFNTVTVYSFDVK